MAKTSAKSLLVNFVKASKRKAYNDVWTLATTEDISGGFEAKIVDELPEVGESKYIYLVKKEESSPGEDVYDEWMWVIQEDETYGWEHIGSTEVQIEIDTEMSSTSENPVQNKVIKSYVDGGIVIKKLTTDDYNYPQNDPDGVALWELPRGVYSLGGVNVYIDSMTSVEYSEDHLYYKRSDYEGNTGIVTDGLSLSSVQPQGAPFGKEYDNAKIVSFSQVADDLVTNDSYKVLSAKQGKVLNEEIGDLSTLTTTAKTSTVDAINELNSEIGNIAQILHTLNNGEES